jgi:hypothetical protein
LPWQLAEARFNRMKNSVFAARRSASVATPASFVHQPVDSATAGVPAPLRVIALGKAAPVTRLFH